jgi:peptidoglycan hydrolase CwlO-like protein
LAKFYIKKISLSGNKVETSSLEFEDGLNIIYGPSNTGKSYIAECLDYMFGCDAKDFRIGKDTGYDSVCMQIVTGNGVVTLERKFEDNQIYIKSANISINSGKYSIGKAKQNINNMWLQLMGINDPPDIIKKETFERQALTLRSFMHTFFIEEDNVFQEESIMFQKILTTRTAILSILLYLMTGDSLKDADPREDKKMKEVRKRAVMKYIHDNLSSLAARRNELKEAQAPDVNKIQQKINSLLREITEAEGQISIAVARSKDLSNEIYALNEQLAECNMLYNRYKILRSQYNSDIKRLTFIVEGELHKSIIPETLHCPFCDGLLPKEEETSCVEAAKAELQKIISQLKDLEDAENDILSERKDLQGKSARLVNERSEIETLINSELKPWVATLRKTLNEYRYSIEIHNETAIIQRFEKSMVADLVDIETEEEPETKYRPREYFNSVITRKINEILTNILESCNFENFSSAYFNLDFFDVVVNGKSKQRYGKGYRAFLNTVVALTFMEYLAQYGVFSPGMLIIDSPILSLKEKGNDKASDSMKASLFQYMLDHQANGQTIIIENEIPDLDYSKANLIRFTKDKSDGRYGLLYGIEE